MRGVNVIYAENGRQGVKALVENPDTDLVLMDTMMPELDGFETAALIRQNPKFKVTPIIFVTAINKDDEYIYRGYEAGAVDYIFKPFEPQILRSKVSIFIELFRKSRQLQLQAEIIRESERRERYLKLAELELENLKRYRNLADAIPHMVWRAKGDGTLDYFNQGWMDYTGLPIEKSVGSGWQTSIHQEDLRSFLKIWMTSMTDGQPFENECRIRSSGGEFRWYWVKAMPELNATGNVVAWLGTCTDIHERRMTQEKLITAQQEAISANASKTNFLANMSHEIRTPMNAILGFTEIMLDADQSPLERIKCIHTVQRNGIQLLKIIDEILDISKVEAGRLQVENIEVNLTNLLLDLRSLLQLQAQDKKLDFKFTLRSATPRWIFSDPTRLHQILLNLIGNAIKFTKNGYVHVDIDWKTRAEISSRGQLQIRTRDSGIGIDPNYVDHLFQPFVQQDSSTTRNFGGTGLGLALSQKLARAMNGDVTLEFSEMGSGSCFLFEIEAEVLRNSIMVQNLDYVSEAKPNKSMSKSDRRIAGAHVLLVEDVSDNQALTARFLSMAGAHVDLASNGEEGRDKALAGNYDVVLMDIQMPILDGYEATKQLRAQNYKTPIIALTAHALNEEREKSIEAGCNDHLTKPVEFNLLIEHIARVIPRASLRESVLA